MSMGMFKRRAKRVGNAMPQGRRGRGRGPSPGALALTILTWGLRKSRSAAELREEVVSTYIQNCQLFVYSEVVSTYIQNCQLFMYVGALLPPPPTPPPPPKKKKKKKKKKSSHPPCCLYLLRGFIINDI